jgi:glycosyltransferase involved in cell wall biosynthesis
MSPNPSANPILTALRGAFVAPAGWDQVPPARPGTPGCFAELVCRLSRICPGSVLVTDPDPAASAAALMGAQASGAQVFIAAGGEEAADAIKAVISRFDTTGRTLIFGGPVSELCTRVEFAPRLLIVRRFEDLEPLRGRLPEHAVVAVTEDGNAPDGLRRWAGSCLYLVQVGTPGRDPSVPESLFQEARGALEASRDPAGREAVFRRLRESASAVSEPALPPGLWPRRPFPGPPLPPTLPGGAPWPRISIVTPTFNQGRYIEQTLLSILHQGYPNLEYIVIDGGSTDETRQILERYRPKLAHLVSEPDRGQSHAINKGMALATGDILTWVNSDDLLAPGALAAMAMAFHTSQADLVAGVACVFSGAEFVDLHLTSCAPGPLPLRDLLDLDGCWNAGQFFYQPEVMFTRGLWERAGGRVREDLFYSMDYDLWVRFAAARARLHVIGRPICWYRQHPEQKTHAIAKFKAELEDCRAGYLAANPGWPHSWPAPPAEPRRQLRVALVNDHGFRYGAGLAHRRLGEGIALAGHELLPLALTNESGELTGASPLTPANLYQALASRQPDLVITGNLHSAGANAEHLSALAGAFPTFAVLHDLWSLTGRCAYPEDCLKYKDGCDHTCPTASEYPSLPLTQIRPAWEAKRAVLTAASAPSLLGNSAWTTEFARQALAAWGVDDPDARTGQIKYGFPLDDLAPVDRGLARRLLGLPEDRFIVMLSSELSDRRKRTREAFEALAQLDLPDLTVVSLGNKVEGEKFPVADVRRPGYLTDPGRLALYKSAADLYLSPSLNETFGQVFVESAACGTPAMGYPDTGVRDAVCHGVSGILVTPVGPKPLAEAIRHLYLDPARRTAMGVWGRIFVENEWSFYSSYHSLFVHWRRSGLTARLEMPPKIGFRPGASPLPPVEPATRRPGTRVEALHIGGEEGPYPDLGLPRFRWAFGPVSRLKIHALETGIHSLVILYRNLQPGQTLHVKTSRSVSRSYPLALNRFGRDRVVCTAVPLEQGPNLVELEFSMWDTNPADPRPMAAVLTGIYCIPDPASEDGMPQSGGDP